MGTCEVCGNQYDKAFDVSAAGGTHTRISPPGLRNRFAHQTVSVSGGYGRCDWFLRFHSCFS